MELDKLPGVISYTSLTCMGGPSLTLFFENGYGVSVIQNDYSYGGREGLYEVAVIKGDQEDWMITYNTPITNDVLGRLTPYDVIATAKKVSLL